MKKSFHCNTVWGGGGLRGEENMTPSPLQPYMKEFLIYVNRDNFLLLLKRFIYPFMKVNSDKVHCV